MPSTVFDQRCSVVFQRIKVACPGIELRLRYNATIVVHYLQEDEHELTSELKEALAEFEKDHPEVTMYVSRISDLLAKMGI